MRFRVVVATVLLATCLAPPVWAQGLASVAPESVGLSAERLTRLEQVIQGYVDRGQVSGVVTLIARRGGQAHLRAYGMADEDDGRSMETDAIFRIASMTKPISSVAVMMLYEEGHFRLNDPVGLYLPVAVQGWTATGSYRPRPSTRDGSRIRGPSPRRYPN